MPAFAYIYSRPILLGAISLDLFAVLLGGVTALLPIYARDILQAGPWALGLLRSAPAVGALAASIVLARHAFQRQRRTTSCLLRWERLGRPASCSRSRPRLPCPLLALAIYGASDAISVVIRQSLVQMRTPYDMLGRVMAVNSMFTGSSGSLGEFRAGAIAAWLGAVPSALIGGFGAIRRDADLVCQFPATPPRRSAHAGSRAGAVIGALGGGQNRARRSKWWHGAR